MKVGQKWREAKSWNVLSMVSLDVLTLERTLLAPPHGRPLPELSSGMWQYWGVSYSELPLGLLEKDKEGGQWSPSF